MKHTDETRKADFLKGCQDAMKGLPKLWKTKWYVKGWQSGNETRIKTGG